MLIAVLGGSPSPEHDVSIASAGAVVKALLEQGFEVLPVYLGRTGFWHISPQVLNGGARERVVFKELGKAFFTNLEDCCPALPIGKACENLKNRKVHLVFPALHGAYGEGGFVQAHLEGLKIPFVGSGSLSSGLAMSKRKTRMVFSGAGLPVARGWHPDPREAVEITDEAFLRKLGSLDFDWPLFLKADHSGSTLGIFKLRNSKEAKGMLAAVRKVDPLWMVEEGVQGPEITVGVLGNADASVLALPPVEIRLRQGDFFDYRSKYDPLAVDEICPAPSLNSHLETQAKDLAIRAHRALNCRGFSRTDMILGPKGFILLETNTIPGLTEVSLFPKAGVAGGFSFSRLILKICKEALKNREENPGMYPEISQKSKVTEENS